MKVYLVYAKMGNQERVVAEIFTDKVQADAYVEFWNNSQTDTIYWVTEKKINQDDWVKILRYLCHG